MYFAHSVEEKPTDEWQGLDEHLKGTAELAEKFGCGKWGRVANDKQNKLSCP